MCFDSGHIANHRVSMASRNISGQSVPFNPTIYAINFSKNNKSFNYNETCHYNAK